MQKHRRRAVHTFQRHAAALAASQALMLATLGTALLAAPSAAQVPASAKTYAIPAGTLEGVLTRFALESGLMLSYRSEDITGKHSPGLTGRHEAADALKRILADTSLAATPQPNGGYVLRAAPAVAPPGGQDGVQTLPLVRVTATQEAETASGPVHGFVARRSATGMKTDTALIEVPQSVSVIGRDELDARGAQSVMEALRYVPGVTVDSYGVETRGSEWALMRGFDSNATSALVDGIRLARSTWINFQTEAYGIERIEVLRGPASVVYGQTEVGGTIHRINKRPQADAVREIELQTGSYGRKQLAADVGGSLDADGTLLYRVVGLALDTDNQLRFAGGGRGSNERQFIAPSLTWRPSTDTTLTVRAEWLRNVNKGFSLYVVRNGQNTGLLRGDPNYLSYEQDQAQLGYELEHRINDTWTVRQNFRQASASVDNWYINPAGAITGNLLPRSARYADDSLRQTALDTHLQARFGQGRLSHTVLMGLDWSNVRADYKEWHAAAGATPPLNLDAPVYGMAFPSPSVLRTSNRITNQQLGVYLQDQIRVDQRWLLTLGGRQDTVENQSSNRLTDRQDKQRDQAFSGRAGVTYLADNGIAPYASYATSFMPQNLRTSSGDPYRPTRGKQWELGVKVQPPSGNSLFTAALFDLTKTNVETYDPSTDDYVQTGKIRSRGLELEAKTRLAPGLQAYAAYTYNDVKVVASQDADMGKTPIQVPRHLASAGFDYAFTGSLQGVSAGLGVRHVGRRYDNPANTQSTPSFTLVDAALRYDNGPWRFALNIANLFDKRYVASRAYGGYYLGAERNFTLMAKYRF